MLRNVKKKRRKKKKQLPKTTAKALACKNIGF